MNTQKEIRKLQLINYISFFLIIMLVGALTNCYALTANDGRMPVHTDKYYIDGTYHCSYQEKEEVKMYWTTDIIPLFGRSFWSIGDALIIFGAIMNVVFCSKFILLGRKKKRKAKGLNSSGS